MSAAAWIAPIALPVAAAAVALVAGRWRAWLVVTAPLPALLLAFAGPPGPAPDLAWILLDLRLDLDPVGRVLLAATALVWLAAGVAARRLTAGHAGAAALWLVTLAGNVGLVLAADVVSLYALYALMTFAAYGLVVHDGTAASRRAGRVYVTMAVVGEVLVLSGLMLAVGVAGGTGVAEIAGAVAGADRRDLIVGLLAAGFAVKAGVVPLHMWLPLAHPEAPIPASAALSGAMIKAGLVGWLKLLPLGAVALRGWAAALVAVGLVTALAGVGFGVVQQRAKVVLAYSSVSQMGLITVLVGVGLAVPAAAPVAVAAAAITALHHGLAKAALFLGVGVRMALPGGPGRRLAIVGAVVAGAALAGAPLTSGWVAKAAAKAAVDALGAPWAARLALALSLAAVGTTVLMVRLVVVLARQPGPGDPVGPEDQARPHGSGPPPAGASAPGASAPGAADRGVVAGWGLAVAGTLVASWVVPGLLLDVARPTLGVPALLDAAWPVAVGLVVAGAVAWLPGLSPVGARAARPLAAVRQRLADGPPPVPPGDLVVVAERLAAPVGRAASRSVAVAAAARHHLAAAGRRVARAVGPGQGFARVDRSLTRWRPAGVLFVLLGIALAVALSWVPG